MGYTLAHFGVQDYNQWKLLKALMNDLTINGLAKVFTVNTHPISGHRYLFSEDLRPLDYLYIFWNSQTETYSATLGWTRKRQTTTYNFPDVTVNVKNAPAMVTIDIDFLPNVIDISAKASIWANKKEGIFLRIRILRNSKELDSMRYENPDIRLHLSTLLKTVQ